MEEFIRLAAGDRLGIRYEQESLCLSEGQCEIYVCSNAGSGRKQLFLLEINPGETIFPFPSETSIELFVYAVKDCIFIQKDIEAYSLPELRAAVKGWSEALFAVPWVERLATINENAFTTWFETLFEENSSDSEKLTAELAKAHREMAKLVAVQFARQEQKESERLQMGRINKRRLRHQSVVNLLPDDDLPEFPFVSPADDIEIAPVVRMVARHFSLPEQGITLPPEIARRLSPEMLMQRLFRRGNMMLRQEELGGDWYKHDSGVFVGYYGEKRQLVALLPKDSESYRIVSADNPSGEPVTAEISKALTLVWQCYASFPARRLEPMDLVRFMLRRTWKSDYLTIIAVSIVCGFLPILTPIITETIFSDIIPIKDRQSLAAVAQVMLLSGFTTAAVTLVRSVAVLRISTSIDINVDAALWARLLQLPAKFFRQYTTGELLNRMQGISAIKQFLTGEMVGTLFNAIFSFWSLLLMIRYSIKLTILAVFVWAVYIIVQMVIFKRALGFQEKQVKANNKAWGTIQQIFNGLPKFRIHGAELQAFVLWTKEFGEQWRWTLKGKWQDNYTSIIAVVQPIILTMLLYYTTIKFVNNGAAPGEGIGYPEFMGFQAAFSSFNATITAIFPMLMQFFAIRPQLENLRPILEEEPETTEDKCDALPLTGSMEVSHLAFSYGPGLPQVLKDVSFKIQPREKVAIVGRSGCGKSTLLRLLLGMEKPDSGEISYDGQDLAELNLPSVRSQLGVVMQNGQLMSGDILTNITGATTMTVDDAWQAAEMTGIAQDIREMPMGMQTIISEGSTNISGGQRQRILLARAIVGRPPLVMLDEATSALDNTTQAIVTDSLTKMKSAQIIIAHRLSTIRNVDRILVLDGGVIAEDGSYDELIAQDGIFAQMAKRQIE